MRDGRTPALPGRRPRERSRRTERTPSAAVLERETASRACRGRTGRRGRDPWPARRSGRWRRGRTVGWRWSCCWLLLSETMQGAQPPHEIDGVDPYDRSVIDQVRKDAERYAVLRVVEGRHQDGAVRDVEVRIARGETLSLEGERSGHREIDHLDLGAILESHRLQALTVFLQCAIVRVVRVRLPAQRDRAGVDEAAQVVDVAVRVVTRDSLTEPQDVRHLELVAQHGFDLAEPEPRVPDLNGGIEQTLLRCEEGAPPVHVDAAALEHHLSRTGPGAEQTQLEPRGHPLGNPVVLLPVGILGPGVEAEPRDRHLAPRGRAPDEHGTEITGPASIGGEAEELDTGEIHARARQHVPRLPLVPGGVHENAGDFARDQRPHDLAIHPRNRSEFARPVASDFLDAPEVDLTQHDGLAVLGRFGHDGAKRIGEKRRAPELDAVAGGAGRSLVADPVHRCDVTTVRDRVAPLDGAPSVELLSTVRRLLLRVPANRRRIEQHVGAVRRAPSGYHWSQQTSVPIRPTRVSNARKPRSPGVK